MLTLDGYNDIWVSMEVMVEVIGYLVLVLLVFSVFFHKMVGVEVVNVIQMIVCLSALSTTNNINVSAFRIYSSMMVVLGSTPLIMTLEGSTTTTLIDPQSYRFFSEHRSIVMNLNLFAILLLGISILYLLLRLINFKRQLSLKNYEAMGRLLLQKQTHKDTNKTNNGNNRLTKLKR